MPKTLEQPPGTEDVAQVVRGVSRVVLFPDYAIAVGRENFNVVRGDDSDGGSGCDTIVDLHTLLGSLFEEDLVNAVLEPQGVQIVTFTIDKGISGPA